MKKILILLLVALSLTMPVFANGSKEVNKNSTSEEKITLHFLGMAQAAYSEQNVNDMTADFMKENPNIIVETEFVPYEELRNKTLLAYGSKTPYDVVLVDDIWFAEFNSKQLLNNISSKIPQEYQDGILEGGWNFVTKDGNVIGLPWFLDSMYLYYNKAMLKEAGFDNPPTSLEELASMAKTIKEKGIVDSPIVLSLAQAEALMCVYSNILEGYNGDFQNAQGEYSLNTTGGLEALNYLINLNKAGTLNQSSLEYLEEDVRRVFSSGDAAFTFNWSYMYSLAKDPAESQINPEDVGIMVIPGAKGIKESAAMSGSMGLGIVSKSANPDAALKYALYLCSKEVQDQYSNLQLPVWKDSYDDPEIQAGRKDLVLAAKKAFSIMNARPSDPNYQEASSIFQEYIQKALYNELTPETALKEAVTKVNNIN